MSSIEWTDVTWNPVIGCAKVSAGCKHCYAERSAHRVASLQGGGVYLQVLRTGTDERGNIEQVDPRWNGRAVFLPERLAEPMRWRKPRRVFVNSMSDLFHEDISFEQIAAVFGVMAATPRHTFQVLTKRPARMLGFFRWMERAVNMWPEILGDQRRDLVMASGAFMSGVPYPPPRDEWPWPLPNVHLGVSVEDQAAADERIPLLLQCPAALRFLSVEPLLGPVDLTSIELARVEDIVATLNPLTGHIDGPDDMIARVDWVIVGGESGPGARACDVSWIRSVVEQCRGAGVPVFVKQLGQNCITQHPVLPPGNAICVPFVDRKGADPSEWPDDLRVQEFPEVPHG